MKRKLKAIWNIIRDPFFVVMTSDNKGRVSARFNVNHHSFRLMVGAVDPAYEAVESEASIDKQVKDILSK